MIVEWMMIPTGSTIFTSPILQKVYTVWFLWSLRKHCRGIIAAEFTTIPWYRNGLVESRARSVVQVVGRRMMKLASLTKLASSMFHVILTNGFVRPYRKHWFGRVQRTLHTTSALNIRRMPVLARSTVLASSCPKIISTVFHWLVGFTSLHKLSRDRHGATGRSVLGVSVCAMRCHVSEGLWGFLKHNYKLKILLNGKMSIPPRWQLCY